MFVKDLLLAVCITAILVGIVGLTYAAVKAVDNRDCPYSKEQWQAVRRGWWGEAALICVLGWLYLVWPIIVFTIWQRPGERSLLKRLAVAVGMSILLVVPLTALMFVVPWSRDWYFRYTMLRLDEVGDALSIGRGKAVRNTSTTARETPVLRPK